MTALAKKLRPAVLARLAIGVVLITIASLEARVGSLTSGPRAAGSVASAPQVEAASVLFADGRAGGEPTASASAWGSALTGGKLTANRWHKKSPHCCGLF